MKKILAPFFLCLFFGQELFAERAVKPQKVSCQKDEASIDGSLFDPGSSEELCLAKADPHQKSNGCKSEQRAVYVPNGSKPPLFVCAPRAKPVACKETEDLLIALPYPHEWGKVFIPKEARCGGDLDLILLLHGVVLKGTKPSMMLGGGVTEKDRYLEAAARKLIDEKKSRPVIIADPTDIGTSCQLYDESDFDFLDYFQRLHKELAAYGIKVRSISAAGHSGSACCLKAGMYRIMSSFPDLLVWGSIDSCYGSDAYARFAADKLSETTMFTVTRTGKFQKESSYLKEVLGKKPEALRCDEKQFDSCQKNPSKPWYIFQTTAATHHYMPKPHLLEMMQRFFPAE